MLPLLSGIDMAFDGTETKTDVCVVNTSFACSVSIVTSVDGTAAVQVPCYLRLRRIYGGGARLMRHRRSDRRDIRHALLLLDDDYRPLHLPLLC